MKVKYLVLAELNIEHRDKWPAKAQKWAEIHGKHADMFPEYPVGFHFFANSSKAKAMAVWDTDDPEKVARKLQFMLPEVSYKLIPLIPGDDWFKAYASLGDLK